MVFALGCDALLTAPRPRLLAVLPPPASAWATCYTRLLVLNVTTFDLLASTLTTRCYPPHRGPPEEDRVTQGGGVEAVRVVLPGDTVMHYNTETSTERIFLGPGLRWEDGMVRAAKPGLLKKTQRQLYFVDTHQKRYIPQRREYVIGIVTKKKGDAHRVDIGCGEDATISYLSFENASKKTRRYLNLGDLLYGQLMVANKDMEPELVCIDIYDQACGMGVLPPGGVLFNVSLHVAREIINPHSPFLLTMSQKVKYTLVVGMNGRVWVNTTHQKDTVAIMNCILMLEHMSPEEADGKALRVLEALML
ncbi:Exosome complex component RRP40 [Chionoecetes opilio]|uniref:Ribosomal RNA-processing protein 40 n=1 Tax=Chionoecetes opilio TaxID=41210 RepID=A0A8J4YST3_CHIOP|nr:Exosome complex component RRP40 [Chionoecetes opilio]